MICDFCKSAAYGCTPGRCFSPRSRAVDEKIAAPARPLAPPLGPKRAVLTSTRRSGPSGATIWVLDLDCGHVIWRTARRPPRTTQCIACSEPVLINCACGCGATSTEGVRFTRWWWHAGGWFAPGHQIRAARSAS